MKPAVPALAQLPAGVVTLADHEAHARSVLDDNAWAYYAGGAGDEITLRANRSAWDALSLYPRVLRRLAGGHTRVRLLGREIAHPILLAPVAFQRMAHPDGELASAHAAAALDAGLVLSTQSSVLLEDVAAVMLRPPLAPTRGPLWFQLYWQRDRGFLRELLARVERAGYEAVVLTVDAATSGVRDRERRAGFRRPPGITAINMAGRPRRPVPRCKRDKARCSMACCRRRRPGTRCSGCSRPRACPCCSRGCCTLLMPHRLPRCNARG
jgi:4-hydroxymandelate oxidase